MRRLFVTCQVVLSLGLGVSCAHRNQTVEISVQRAGSASAEAVVRLDVPADWHALVPSRWRAEYLSPDNLSRAYVRAMPVEADTKACPQVARRYASEFIQAWGGPPQTRLARKRSAGETVDFELRRTEPKPNGEIIWARVICREGALAIASCTVAAVSTAELTRRCQDIVRSLQVRLPP
jgi:hypothetical protein